jgi:hypothetical protein
VGGAIRVSFVILRASRAVLFGLGSCLGEEMGDRLIFE